MWMKNVTQRLQRLTPQELQILDTAITPEIGAIIVKAFPELEPLIAPLMQQQTSQQGVPMGPGPGQPMPPMGGGALGGMAPGGGY